MTTANTARAERIYPPAPPPPRPYIIQRLNFRRGASRAIDATTRLYIYTYTYMRFTAAGLLCLQFSWCRRVDRTAERNAPTNCRGATDYPLFHGQLGHAGELTNNNNNKKQFSRVERVTNLYPFPCLFFTFSSFWDKRKSCSALVVYKSYPYILLPRKKVAHLSAVPRHREKLSASANCADHRRHSNIAHWDLHFRIVGRRGGGGNGRGGGVYWYISKSGIFSIL